MVHFKELSSVKVISVNTNGIRAAARKGFFDWLAKEQPDAVCIQETKAQEDQLSDEVFYPQGYHRYFCDAQKKGYSGVAIYCKKEPDQVIKGIGWEDFDSEGRWIRADFGKLSIISLYLPSGSSGEVRQNIKYDFMERFKPVFEEMAKDGREYIICGDWNIVHKEIDIKNWKQNQKTSGVLPDERAWLDHIFDDIGFVDVFRTINTDAHEYTWWSNRGQAWANNVGWRIDYHISTKGIADTAKSTSIYRDERFSDHAPLTINYDYDL